MAREGSGIAVRRIGGRRTWRVILDGEHDLATAPAVAAAVERALAGGDAVLDLTRVTFADSSILAVIVDAAKRAGRDRFAVVLPPTGVVLRLFELVDAGSAVTVLPAADAEAGPRPGTAQPEASGGFDPAPAGSA